MNFEFPHPRKTNAENFPKHIDTFFSKLCSRRAPAAGACRPKRVAPGVRLGMMNAARARDGARAEVHFWRLQCVSVQKKNSRAICESEKKRGN